MSSSSDFFHRARHHFDQSPEVRPMSLPRNATAEDFDDSRTRPGSAPRRSSSSRFSAAAICSGVFAFVDRLERCRALRGIERAVLGTCQAVLSSD